MSFIDSNGARNAQTVAYMDAGQISGHRVLRNTYMLLSMTLLFSAFTAGMSMMLNLPHPGGLITLAVYFGLLFATTKLRNSAWGLVSVFALTGFLGMTLGPVINFYLHTRGGGTVVMGALGLTAVIFMGLSAYVLVTKRDFSFMGGFLSVGVLVIFVVSLAAMFLQIPGLTLAISAGFVLLMSGMILYETSEIIHGGETNYIMATVSLYVTIFNLFVSLLNLLGGSNRD